MSAPAAPFPHQILNFVNQDDFPFLNQGESYSRTWVVQNVKHSDLVDYRQYSGTTCTLFLRDSMHAAMVEVQRVLNEYTNNFNALVASRMPLVDFSGPSGCGKSTLMFGVFCNSPFPNKIWVTGYSSSIYFGVVHFHDNQYDAYEEVASHQLSGLIRLLPESTNGAVSLLVFDGTFEIMYPVNEHMREIQNLKLCVICCSGSALFHVSALVQFDVVTITVPSFTLSEYDAAWSVLGAANTKLAGRTRESLSQWYYIVGGNSRVFFNSPSIVHATKAMDGFISSAGTYRRDLIAGTIEPRTVQFTINNLMSYIAVGDVMRYTIISRYVLEKFLVAEGLASIRTARLLLSDNASYQGWLIAALIIASAEISTSKHTPFVLHNRKGFEELHVSNLKIRYFDDHSQLPVYGYQKTDEYTLFVPKKWYNPGYDAMLVHTRDKWVKVRILQVTVASTHSCDLTSSGDFLLRMFDNTSGTPGQPLWRPPKTPAEMPPGYAPPPYVPPEEDQFTTSHRQLLEVGIRGVRSKTTAAVRFFHRPKCIDANQLRMEVHYCIVTTAENIREYSHSAPMQHATTIERFDPMFKHDASYHTYYCMDK